MTLFPVLNLSITLSNNHWIMLFLQTLDSEGQGHFDAMNLMIKFRISQVIQLVEELWGIQQSAFSGAEVTATTRRRHERFSRTHSPSCKCRYNIIHSTRFEKVMKIQCLIAGIIDDGSREKLLFQEEEDSFLENVLQHCSREGTSENEVVHFQPSPVCRN
ncbi:unnamed protein product [Dicrocoelium dendriticum]|nr:unnamed protein product [Dicrocoelium dendriticum]